VTLLSIYSTLGVEIAVPRAEGVTVSEEQATRQDDDLAEELLVEEVSIDGMCGVY
jgi:mycofactocin precursor